MLFPTTEFALFFLLVFLTSWFTRSLPKLRKIILTIASYAFYGWWDPRFMWLLLACTAVNYVLGLTLEEQPSEARRKIVVSVAIAFNLGILGFFKYFGFFTAALADFVHALGASGDIKFLEVVLPVGISFYTFQGISYVVDIYRREIKAVSDPVDMLLFKSFFPQLVAGPIVRASEFLPQLAESSPSDIRATRAFLLIGLGLAKKVILAHYLAVLFVQPAFDSPTNFGSFDLLVAAYAYAMQIYCDFSAYSDMAIGVALLFGYEFPRNFDQPYRATSLKDFWRRWHISLSSFLRDYLYIPLGGSRGGSWQTYRNLILTMVLGGLWHGAAWNFVIWGLLHGFGLALERLWSESLPSLQENGIWRGLKGAMTFHFVCLAWIFFNADSSSAAFTYLSAMGKFWVAPKLLSVFGVSMLISAIAGQLLPGDLIDRLEERLQHMPLVAQAAVLGTVVVAIAAMGPGALSPFIYFKF